MGTHDVEYLIGLRDQFSNKLKGIRSQAKGMDAQMGSLGGTIKKFAGIMAGAFAADRIIRFGSESIKLYNEQVQAEAQVKQGLLSTGNAAGISFEKLKKAAEGLQKKTLFGDETILQNATAQFLTFSNISGDQLLKVQKTALDLTTRLYGTAASGEALRSISIQLGKALDDPSKGLTALRRSGVSFSESEVTLIKHLQETNQLAKAQGYILEAVNKQYGGSAEAAAQTGAGRMIQLKNTFNDVRESFGDLLNQIQEKFIPILMKLVNGFKNLIEWLTKHKNTVIATIKVIGVIITMLVAFRVAGFLVAKSMQIAIIKTNL